MIEGLYLHIPFCAKRCAYCDFATEACHDDARMDAYVDGLSLAIRRASRKGLLGSIKTVYLGGGTPSYLGTRRLNSLVYLISLSINLENVEEFTVEANPDSIDERMVKDLFALGVDRFSLGAQSFDDEVLRAYGRIHDARQIEQAVTCIKGRVENFSLDLICGGPGQSMQSWEDSLERALASGAKHISIYPLTLEEGTPLFAQVEAGTCTPPDEDVEADMMERAGEVLEAAGMHRYEVASYAYPGFESRHNSSYWSGVEYLGLGAGAASMLSCEDYRACVDAGLFASDSKRELSEDTARVRVDCEADTTAFNESLGAPHVQVETLTNAQAQLEDLMLGMRKSSGVSFEQVRRAAAIVPKVSGVFLSLEERGLVAEKQDRYVPAKRGWLCGNEVYGAIWGLA